MTKVRTIKALCSIVVSVMGSHLRRLTDPIIDNLVDPFRRLRLGRLPLDRRPGVEQQSGHRGEIPLGLMAYAEALRRPDQRRSVELAVPHRYRGAMRQQQ